MRYVLGSLIIRGDLSENVSIDFFNLAGQRIGQSQTKLVNGYAECPVGQLTSGCYIARVSDAHGHSKACKFVKD